MDARLGREKKFIPREEALLLHDLLSKVFTYDSEKRIFAAELLEHLWFAFDGAKAES